MLTTDDMLKIYKEASLGMEPSIATAEAMEYRKKLDVECEAIRKSGKSLAMPHEVPGESSE